MNVPANLARMAPNVRIDQEGTHAPVLEDGLQERTVMKVSLGLKALQTSFVCSVLIISKLRHTESLADFNVFDHCSSLQ